MSYLYTLNIVITLDLCLVISLAGQNLRFESRSRRVDHLTRQCILLCFSILKMESKIMLDY